MLARIPKAAYNSDTKRTLCSRSKDLYTPIKLTSIPISLTYGTFESHLLTDPSSFEEPLLDSFINVIVKEDGEAISVMQEGLAAVDSTTTTSTGMETDVEEETASTRTVERCIQNAKDRRLEIMKVLKI